MKKQILTAALALTLIAPVQAQASQQVGSITVTLNVGDLPVMNGAFQLCQVGTATSDGYRIHEDFGGGFVRQEDGTSPHLAQWMAEAVGDSGRTLLMDVDGNVGFTGVSEGLYLLVQTAPVDGFYPIQPFLVSMPKEGRWEVQVNLDPLPRVTESPATGEDHSLALGLAGMFCSGVGIAGCAVLKKRKKPA